MRPCGPASKYVPTIKAAFVRRKEDYGMWWPGAVYDGKAARRRYTAQLIKTAKTLGAKLDLRPEPIYSIEEADAWLAQAKAAKVDGLPHRCIFSGRHIVYYEHVGSGQKARLCRLFHGRFRPGRIRYENAKGWSENTPASLHRVEGGQAIRQING